jgi:hypothetical protein
MVSRENGTVRWKISLQLAHNGVALHKHILLPQIGAFIFRAVKQVEIIWRRMLIFFFLRQEELILQCLCAFASDSQKDTVLHLLVHFVQNGNRIALAC